VTAAGGGDRVLGAPADLHCPATTVGRVTP